MSTAARGVGDIELVRMIDKAYMRLAADNITGPIADRIMVTMVLGACNLASGRAREVADRLFPTATRPALTPEGKATDQNQNP